MCRLYLSGMWLGVVLITGTEKDMCHLSPMQRVLCHQGPRHTQEWRPITVEF